MKIKCPNCSHEFELTDAGYQEILAQVRDKTFTEEIERIKKESQNNLANVEKNTRLQTEKEANEKIASLNAKIKELENNIQVAQIKKENEINTLKNDYQNRINVLNNSLAEQTNITKSQISEAVHQKELEIVDIKSKLNNAKNDEELKISNLKEQHSFEIKKLQELVDYYKDLKSKLSTKMVGETLERHCEIEFETKLRPFLRHAEFHKDNTLSDERNSKGDYVFRDKTDDGVEYISIMFEMKNECDTTSTKKKSEDFLDELDKDRKEKKCEYAVLVSMLDKDSELYNQGIVDVSHIHPKMYVIRPQFFVPLITLLCNAATNTVEAKRELIKYQQQNIDVIHFEENLNVFKEAFGRNYRIANDHFKKAIDEIDDTIKHLQKVRDELTGTVKQLNYAGDKVEDVSTKGLARHSPSLAAEFKKIEKKEEK